MSLEYFVNDKYKVLSCMAERQISVNGSQVIKLSQQEIADILNTSQTMYARYERGANELPVHHLITLCDYYGVSADYFLGREEK